MFKPFQELEAIKKLVNKQKNYVVCQFCNKPIIRKEMVKHMSKHLDS